MAHPELLHMAATQEVDARRATAERRAVATGDAAPGRARRRHRGRHRRPWGALPRWLHAERGRARVGAFPPATEHVDVTAVIPAS